MGSCLISQGILCQLHWCRNPLKGLKFSQSQYRFSIGSPDCFSSLYSVFVSLRVILLPSEIRSLSPSVFSLHLSMSLLGYFSTLFSNTVPLLRGINTSPEWTIYNDRGGMKIPTWQSIPSRLCPASQFISIVDFIFYSLVFSAVVCRCSSQSIISHLSVHFKQTRSMFQISTQEKVCQNTCSPK